MNNVAYSQEALGAMKSNYYRLLGIPRDASREDIAAAYKEILLGLQQGQYQTLSRSELSEAYHTLSTPESRASYDSSLPPESGAIETSDEELPIEELLSLSASSEQLTSAMNESHHTHTHSTHFRTNKSTLSSPRLKLFGTRPAGNIPADGTPISGEYEAIASGTLAARRPSPLARSNAFASYTGNGGSRSLSHGLAQREKVINHVLLAIGIGMPIAAIIAAAVVVRLYF